MKSILPKATLIGGLVVAWGCGSALSPRPPGIGTRAQDVQKRMLEYHDPYIDRSAGPDTQNRPREFSIQRDAPRRAVETRGPLGPPLPPGIPGPQQMPLGGKYPGVVRE